MDITINREDMIKAYEQMLNNSMPEGWIFDMGTYGRKFVTEDGKTMRCGCLLALATFNKDPDYWEREASKTWLPDEDGLFSWSFVDKDGEFEDAMRTLIKCCDFSRKSVIDYWNTYIAPLLEKNENLD